MPKLDVSKDGSGLVHVRELATVCRCSKGRQAAQAPSQPSAARCSLRRVLSIQPNFAQSYLSFTLPCRQLIKEFKDALASLAKAA